MNEHVQVTITFDARDTALRVARGVVEGRLAASAQVSGPIESTFRWRGAVRAATEWQAVLKTTRDRLADLVDYVAAAYPADTPEITAVPIVAGSPDYLQWITAETRPG
jgi:periplasmic divalent cation tolerance protein